MEREIEINEMLKENRERGRNKMEREGEDERWRKRKK